MASFTGSHFFVRLAFALFACYNKHTKSILRGVFMKRLVACLLLFLLLIPTNVCFIVTSPLT